MKLTPRDIPPRAAWALEQAGMHPLLARLLAARGINDPLQMDDAPARLMSPDDLLGAREAATLLDVYSKIAVPSIDISDSVILTKIQLLNSLTSKENVREVWSFYDSRSLHFVKRAQANLHLTRPMLSFSQSENPLSYLYRYKQRELQIQLQIAEERRVKEEGTRKPASAAPKN